MLHAKTAVADGLWSRIGSTNLNIASWLGNYELNVAIEDRRFGEGMAAQCEIDLTHATEIVLTTHNRMRLAERRSSPAARRARSGSAERVAAGVSVGSALTNRRALGAAESGLLTKVSAGAIGLALVAGAWPRAIAWPLAMLGGWLGVAWLIKAITVRRQARAHDVGAPPVTTAPRRGGEEGA